MSYLAKGLAQQAKRVEHAAKMCVADVNLESIFGGPGPSKVP